MPRYLVVMACLWLVPTSAISQVKPACDSPDAWRGQITAISQQIENLQMELDDIAKQVKAREAEIAKLSVEKDEAMEELRLGLFCSKCKRSKSEIERETGKSFYEHLQEVSGSPVPASQDVIDTRAAEYDAKIGTLRQEMARLDRQRAQAEDRKRPLVAQQLPQAVLLWKQAVACSEDQARRAWEAAQMKINAELRAKAQALTAARAKAELERRAQALFEATLRARELEKQHQEEREAAAKQRQEAMKEVADRLEASSAGYLVPPFAGLIGAPIELGFGPLKMTIGFDRIVAEGSFGRFKSTLEVSDDFFHDEMDVKTGLEAYGVGVGIQSATKWSPWGTGSEVTPYFKPPEILDAFTAPLPPQDPPPGGGLP